MIVRADSSTEPAVRNVDSTPCSIEDAIRTEAERLGFAACGITDAGDLDCGPTLEQWIEAQRHGHMDYLASPGVARVRPSGRLLQARAAIVVAWPYAMPGPPDPRWRQRLTGRIAAYAAGTDYHIHVADKLERLAAFVRERTGADAAVHVDGGPLVEKHLARRAGIGWYGHNTNILRPGIGSSFLLGCLITSAPLAADAPFSADHCGTCRACVPACPTDALGTGPTIDARLCISYLTIELRGPLPIELRSRIGNWVFGCDVCQQVCPWTSAASPAAAFHEPYLPGLLEMTREEFRDAYGASAVARTKRRGLARNAAVALGNTANLAAVDSLARALGAHDEPLVRAHCAWALGRLGGADASRALSSAARREHVPPVRAEIAAARQTASHQVVAEGTAPPHPMA